MTQWRHKLSVQVKNVFYAYCAVLCLFNATYSLFFFLKVFLSVPGLPFPLPQWHRLRPTGQYQDRPKLNSCCHHHRHSQHYKSESSELMYYILQQVACINWFVWNLLPLRKILSSPPPSCHNHHHHQHHHHHHHPIYNNQPRSSTWCAPTGSRWTAMLSSR